jgi:hypothetical protein
VEFRVFAAGGITGIRDWTLRIANGADLAIPMRVALVPRTATLAWTADLDGDGMPEWILESAKARAVFSTQDGGRWMEFTWKDTNANFLPESGAFAQAGPVEVSQNGDALEFTGKGWKRTVTLNGSVLTVEQSTPLPTENLASEKRGNITLKVERPTPGRAVYGLK